MVQKRQVTYYTHKYVKCYYISDIAKLLLTEKTTEKILVHQIYFITITTVIRLIVHTKSFQYGITIAKIVAIFTRA
ncbi:hypothetical protein TY91_15195 [Secundilactobacillus collinoides]|uniref:Uncharacterized protein n=1 Tax=Secundilactobacillus collinoides TaxID=33960 RepID=A0A166FUN7_SECCO|nr:hypothetical protein TY91_15195 [Secundilactobacillus collinoides]